MNRVVLYAVILPLCLPAGAAELPSAAQQQHISLTNLRDKIRGGWAGQMIGVSFGFPTEFGYLDRIIPEDELPQWRPEMVREALNQDDLYVDITLAAVLDEQGLDATSEDFGALFREAEYPLWHANLAARRALRRGVPATQSGTPRYNVHANDIDFQIEADFVGLMSPAMPRSSNAIGYRAGRVMNHGDGIYGGMFIGGMYAAAFFDEDAAAVVRAGLAALPETSAYAAVIRDVLDLRQRHPDDWQAAWQVITENWSHGEACPAGALHAFNIDAKINGGYVALALLYGGGEFEKTLHIATRAGQDSDCNPSSALGILGVMRGFSGIPENYSGGIAAIANEKFSFTDYSLNDIVESTQQRAITLALENGGSLDGDSLTIAVQQPEPMLIDAWDDYGTATEAIRFDDERWQWRGGWSTETVKIWRSEHTSRVSGERAAEAVVTFEGSGAVLTGLLLPDGGLADVYLDDRKLQTIDVYPDEPDAKTDESIWHLFGLRNEAHKLRIVVRGEPYAESMGNRISIVSLIVFE